MILVLRRKRQHAKTTKKIAESSNWLQSFDEMFLDTVITVLGQSVHAALLHTAKAAWYCQSS